MATVQFSEGNIDKIILHRVGNKSREEDLICSEHVLPTLDQMVEELLMKYFLNEFRDLNLFHFYHPDSFANNEIYKLATQIFEDRNQFIPASVDLAGFLYQTCTNPKILAGEFYTVLFNNILLDGEPVEAIGLFKSETRDTFLRIYPNDQTFEIQPNDGIPLNRLDRGCLIFNAEAENGLLVMSIEHTNKNNQVRYWQEEFLRLSPRSDHFYHTQNLLQVCKEFCSEILTPENHVEAPDKIAFQKKAMDYLTRNETFELPKFEEEVMETEALKGAFRNFRENFHQTNDVPIFDEFDVSKSALKKGKSVFKSIIKLDKNFHIYVHGNRQFILQGQDPENGMKFYQLYYFEEE
jgi:hypothetical protein